MGSRPPRLHRHGRYALVPHEGSEIHGLEIDEILVERQTPAQSLVIAKTTGFGRALYLDGDFMSCEGDEHLYHGALVMPALLAHPAPRRAVVLGGGEGATARDLLRDPGIESVRMVELDPEVVEACREHMPSLCEGVFDDPRFELVIGDALEVVASEHDVDVMIHDLTDPLEGGPSCPLFTERFFAECRRAMSDAGVMVSQVGALKLWEEPSQRAAVEALRAVFPHVFLYSAGVPSFGCEWTFALASKSPLELLREPGPVDERIRARGIRAPLGYDGTTHTGLMHPSGHLRELLSPRKEPPR